MGNSIFILFTIFSSSFSFVQPPKGNILFIITKTTPYCGGANPSEEIVQESVRKKIPYGESYYIIEGSKNSNGRRIIDTLKLDSTGKVCSSLKPGIYSLINEFQFNKLVVDKDKFDFACMNENWSNALISFKVLQNTCDTITYNIAEGCPYIIPCSLLQQPIPM